MKTEYPEGLKKYINLSTGKRYSDDEFPDFDFHTPRNKRISQILFLRKGTLTCIVFYTEMSSRTIYVPCRLRFMYVEAWSK